MIYARILELSHVRTPGPAQDLCRYLSLKYKFLTFIEHPFKSSIDVLGSTGTRVYKYNNGNLVYRHKYANKRGPEFTYWLRDIWFSIRYIFTANEKFDLTICLDCLNAFSGLILKILRKTNYLIYYTVDITDKRFNNKLLNVIYLLLDKIAYTYADEVWDIGESIKKFRIRLNYTIDSTKEKNVPIGIFPEDYNYPKIIRDKYKIIYLGTISKIMGLQLVINSMPKLIKIYPKLKLEIIGTGEYKDALTELILKNSVKNNVIFKVLNEKQQAIPELFSGSIGIAPYLNDNESFKKYCDPAKIKEYFAAGLPVIITKVPVIFKTIEKRKLGLAIDYSESEFINAVTKMLTDHKLFNQYKFNIRNYIEKYNWDKIYTNALRKYNNNLKIETN
jgi:glycosyltransferase involved in cell wall biosynthesis